MVEGVPSTLAGDGGGGAASSGAGETDGVRVVAAMMGPMQPNIYGEIFDVISSGEHAGINLCAAATWQRGRVRMHAALPSPASPPAPARPLAWLHAHPRGG